MNNFEIIPITPLVYLVKKDYLTSIYVYEEDMQAFYQTGWSSRNFYPLLNLLNTHAIIPVVFETQLETFKPIYVELLRLVDRGGYLVQGPEGTLKYITDPDYYLNLPSSIIQG